MTKDGVPSKTLKDADVRDAPDDETNEKQKNKKKNREKAPYTERGAVIGDKEQTVVERSQRREAGFGKNDAACKGSMVVHWLQEKLGCTWRKEVNIFDMVKRYRLTEGTPC
jgi:hypothetical protein